MKKIKIDSFIYILHMIIHFVIVLPTHNRNGIRSATIFYLFFSLLFWFFYMLIKKMNIDRAYLLSLPCLIILCFLDKKYYRMYESVELFGVFKQVVFYYFIVGYFILDFMLYLSYRRIKKNRYY